MVEGIIILPYAAGTYKKSLHKSAAGMNAQTMRMSIISQNMAHADTVIGPGKPGYKRQIPVFKDVWSEQVGTNVVRVVDSVPDVKAPEVKEYDPTHPFADADGYITKPPIRPMIEMTDMVNAKYAHYLNSLAYKNTTDMTKTEIGILT